MRITYITLGIAGLIIGLLAIVIGINRNAERDAFVQMSPQSAHERSENYGIILAELEQNMEAALKTGGITPKNFDAIEAKLGLLDAQGIEPERVAALRQKLGMLSVGGREPAPRKDAPRAEPVKVVTTPLEPQSQSQPQPVLQPTNTSVQTPKGPPQPTCTSTIAPVFTHALVDPALVTNILPPPNRPKTDLTVLKTHSYISTVTQDVPIYAPTDMEFYNGTHYVGGPYTLDFRVSCEVTVRLAHIREPVAKIRDLLPKEAATNSHDQPIAAPVAFKAGEIIGYSGGPPHILAVGFDFGVYNSATPNRFASEPEKYTSTIYTTAVCPFAYFTPELKNAYRTKFYLQIHGGMQYDLPHFCD